MTSYKLKRHMNGENVKLTRDDLPTGITINGGISDLWFNHDHSEYAPNGHRDDYDINAMIEEARGFIIMLESAGIMDAPNEYELVADFFNRL